MSTATDVVKSPNATGAVEIPPHHVAKPGLFGPRFTNPWDTFEKRSFKEVLQWHRERRKSGIDVGRLKDIAKPTEADYRRAFPAVPVDWAALAAPPEDAVQAVWVGHATVLAQMGGLTFITDPVFSERCAPVQFAGPKRVVPPALNGTEPQLPQLDFVLISHNHYDHLDTGSVRTLYRRYGKSLTWYVPLGLRPWFAAEGIPSSCVVELDWWQSATHTSERSGRSATVTMVPAQHWSARGVLDRSRTLWGGYVVSTPRSGPGNAWPDKAAPGASATAVTASAATPAPAADGSSDGAAAGSGRPLRFYFVGDTGYCSVFKEIGERFGHIDLAAVPIGAYDPRWFMRPQHVNAEEGLQIAVDVRAAVGLAIHYATWALTDEPMDEPAARLQAALRERGLPASSFVCLRPGERALVREGRLANTPLTLPVE